MRAAAAAAQALSYRNFRVGCAVYAWKPWREGDDLANYLGARWRVFTGANLKPDPDTQKFCAERSAINASRSAGYTKIIGFAVVGKPQPDDESGLTHSTLHPCGVCRRTLGALPEVSGETRVLTGSPQDQDILVHEFSFEELLALHGTRI